ncbi:hypothetical protein RJT34_23387 [Clitoria ternatea]|uniref:Uncharacterized protein n=1 Tax=Clitoria ternatea TaxID=43366 RepID=A0AAN9FMG8_CLITE
MRSASSATKILSHVLPRLTHVMTKSGLPPTLLLQAIPSLHQKLILFRSFKDIRKGWYYENIVNCRKQKNPILESTLESEAKNRPAISFHFTKGNQSHASTVFLEKDGLRGITNIVQKFWYVNVKVVQNMRNTILVNNLCVPQTPISSSLLRAFGPFVLWSTEFGAKFGTLQYLDVMEASNSTYTTDIYNCSKKELMIHLRDDITVTDTLFRSLPISFCFNHKSRNIFH